MKINELKPATTQMPLNEYNLPVSNINMNLRGVSDPTLGKEAAMGLKALTGLVGTDFTITSARRHDNEKSMHHTGNAIDFGVQNKDGKSMLNFFFTDPEYTKLSDAGKQYLIDHNAELIDERTRPGQPHFHLEFNNPEKSRVLAQGATPSLYADGAKTSTGDFPIYGVQGTWQPNDYNQNVDFLGEMKKLAGLDDFVDIGPTSDFYKQYGISSGTITRQTEGKGIFENARKAEVDPETIPEYTPTTLDPFDRYSTQRRDKFTNFVVPNFMMAPGYLPSAEDLKKDLRRKVGASLDFRIKVPFAQKNSEYDDFLEKQDLQILGPRGITLYPGASKTEAAGDMQNNWQKWSRGIGGGIKAFANVIGSAASMIYFGLPMAVTTGRFDQLYNNGLNNLISEYDKHLSEEFPHYYTAAEAQQTEGFATSWDAFGKALGTANFWSRDFLQGVGFLLGAVRTGRFAAEAQFGAKAFDVATAASRRLFPRQMANAFRKASFADGIGTLAAARRFQQARRMANYAGAGLVSAAGEATIEANHIFQSSYERIKQMKREGAGEYEGMSDAEMRELAAGYSDVAWALNLLIVGGSNMLMFPRLLGAPTKNLQSRLAKNLIKRGPKGTLEFTGRKLPQFFKGVGKDVLRGPVQEGFEEWSQYALELGSKDYFGYTHNLSLDGEIEKVTGGIGLLNSIARGYLKVPQTKEGLQSVFLGALLGSLGGTYSVYTGNSATQNHMRKVTQAKKLVEDYNVLNKGEDLYKIINSLAALDNIDKIQAGAVQAEDLFTANTAEMKRAFEIIDLFYETDQVDILNDMINDARKLSKERFEAEFEIEPDAGIDQTKQIDRIQRSIRRYEDLKDNDPLINRLISAMSVEMSEDEQAEEKIQALKRELRYSVFMSQELDDKGKELLQEIISRSQGAINPSYLQEYDLTDLKGYTDAKTLLDAQFEEMLKRPDAPGVAQQGYLVDLLNQYSYFNQLRQQFNKYAQAIYDAPFQKVNEEFAERNQKEKEAKRKNDLENEKIVAAQEFQKKKKAEEEAAEKARRETKSETAPEGFKKTPPETAPKGFTQEGEKSPGRQVVSEETIDKGKRKGKKRIVYSETTEETIQPEGVNIKVTKYTVEIGGKKVGGKSGKQMSLREFLDEYEISEEDQELLSEYDLDNTVITISEEREAPADSRFNNTIAIKITEKGELGSLEITINGKRKTKPAPPAAPTVTPTAPASQTDGENINTVNQANTENLEIPENNDVDIENNQSNASQDDGKSIGDITYLGDILSLAWKSSNNTGGLTGVGEDLNTTQILENPNIESMAGATIQWSIDMQELDIRAGGKLIQPSKRISRAALQQVKDKKELSQQDLDNLPIVGVSTRNGKTIRAYVHTAAYVDTNIKPDNRVEEKQKIRAFRKKVYNAIIAGQNPTSIITEHTIGHLNYDATGQSKNDVSLVLNGGKPGTKQVNLMFNDGFNYVDENGVPEVDLLTSANPRAKGAVYFKLPAANQETFPARVFIENLHRETAEVLLAIYAGVTNRQVSFKTRVSKEFAESLPNKGVMKLYRQFLLDTIKESPGRLKFTDLVNMLIYDNTKGLEITFNPVSKTTVLKLGTQRYTRAELETKKEEILDWFVENKRYNISKIQANGNNNYRYNDFLIKSKILYTNIFANQSTEGAFIQPTLRFGEIIPPSKPKPPTTPTAPKGPINTLGKFTRATLTEEEKNILKKQVKDDSQAAEKITNETAESAQLALEFEEADKQDKKVQTFMFGGVQTQVAKDEKAPEDFDKEGETAPTVEGEKESVSPNQVMPITEIEDYLKGKLPKLINRDAMSRATPGSFEFIAQKIVTLATVPNKDLGSTSAVIGGLGAYPSKKMLFNDIIKAIYNLTNENTAEQIELAAEKVLKEEELYVDPKGEIRSLVDDEQHSTLLREKDSVSPNQVTKIISGGQTGVDRIGLEVGKELNIETGGVAPKGYRTEKGPDTSLKEFGLTEDTSSGYTSRTLKNLKTADGTVLFGNMKSPGSKQTINNLEKNNKPYIVNPTAKDLQKFLTDNNIKVLNVAGNRGSKVSSENAAKYAKVLKDALYYNQGFDTPTAVKAPNNKNNIIFGELKNKPKVNLSRVKKPKDNKDNLEDKCPF